MCEDTHGASTRPRGREGFGGGVLEAALADTRLSARALGILLICVRTHHGEVPAATDLARQVKEGRDAIRAGLRELREHGYITTIGYQSSSGQWSTTSTVVPTPEDIARPRTENPPAGDSTEDGFSGPLQYTDNNDQSLVLIGSKEPLTGFLTTPGPSARREKIMGYEWFPRMSSDDPDEGLGLKTETSEQKAERRRETLGASGARRSGGVVIKPAATSARYGKDLSRWSMDDMVAEFTALASDLVEDRAGQVNASALKRRLREYGKKSSTAALAQGIRDFFADPRNLHDVGTGSPLWLRFSNWYPTVQSRLERSVGNDAVSREDWEQQVRDQAATMKRKF